MLEKWCRGMNVQAVGKVYSGGLTCGIGLWGPGDTVQNLASVFQYYYQEFHSAQFHSTTTMPEVANAYLNGVRI